MPDKQIYDLNADDFESHGVWFFPIDDTVEDELTARPLQAEETCSDAQVVVRTVFAGADGTEYKGYLYWDDCKAMEYLKPVVFLSDGSAVSFWSGLIKPAWSDYSPAAGVLRSVLPVAFTSDSLLGLPSISGLLEGLYYLDEDTIACVV
ncbi:hypothetical protein [Pseudomonas soli]|uniref:hypothetical protein n=1 Tax=Pseudomonas soli TaxID=1306993 RepID=UPI0003C7CE6E|nr:hypothetical protein O165_011160 [Pseudomonas soli]